ncbi:acyl-protein thioesterase 1 [Ostrinia nubilalis]|uniref:acyl-protein thioesterase 1 n=1 Tax=Ostrinia furnacalis TaxID=93504 RepID=UPI00103D2699|nr:acyl-protein thioesterase 1 [Ostrinia furnacalis]XP_028165602.1 acyl-protein thioesterase 1 [Ostrinia furnacalis]XP_028165603.1 acyl-protein thioesterase 1 [Ostrinia furnacalis]XP_028165604.1 acyl-protein thioesterase 1 [Ostrinia furnacalis]XP_028165606.1 acyl-protein thioesterase 1 [Ostrinia furnacalis]XP_028165607.1 acyl-protein thioesterase 1 [Ostrinia furnacalis]XP_028165608.1 acyl-protein thioesterase 1 [Ostrinia furnacalis]XP_028165609.1 acyl-protein thioesterase 1 [Ostrinia furnaca
MEPNPVIIAATAKHTASLIFFHGLGDTGHGWASTIAAIRGPHVKVICPTASTMPVTLNAGFRMPSWFDLRTLDATAPEDEEGILRTTKLVHALIADEVKGGIPANRILVGGFSQGGALALHSALTYPESLAGVMSLSCWLPRHAHFPDGVKAPLDLPIFQAHGDCDPVVPFKWGQMTASFLKTFMKNIEFTTYQGLTHSSSEAELKDMRAFIDKTLPATK